MKLLNPPDYILAKNLQAAKWKLKKAHKLQTVGSSEAQQQSKKPRKLKSSANKGRKSRARSISGTVEFD